MHAAGKGILLPRDLHAQLDKGYVTITPAEVGRRIREEFETGRDYYLPHGATIHVPRARSQRPAAAFLEWHSTNIYKG